MTTSVIHLHTIIGRKMTTLTNNISLAASTQISGIRNKYMAEQTAVKNLTLQTESNESAMTEVRKQLAIFENYSDKVAERKINIDNYIWNIFKESMPDEEASAALVESLSTLYATTMAIYEHLNVAPQYRTYFKEAVLESSEEDIKIKAKAIIEDHVIANHNALDDKSKDRKYRVTVIAEATSIIEASNDEDINTKDILTHCYRAEILRSLVENITIPYQAKCCIESTLTNTTCNELFDNTKLVELMESYNNEVGLVSSIASLAKPANS